MKTVWGLMLVASCLLLSRNAHAEKWLPYVSGAVQPRMLMLETVEEQSGPDNRRIDGFLWIGQQLEAGLHINRFDLYLAYMRNLTDGEWYAYDYYDDMPGSESEIHMSIEGWLDQRLLLGFRHYPKATQYQGAHFLFGGAVGFCKAQFDEHLYHVFGSYHQPPDTTDDHTYTSDIFISLHFDLGVSISASRKVDVLLLFQTDQAEVDIKDSRYRGNLNNYIKVRIPKLHVGIRYLFGRE